MGQVADGQREFMRAANAAPFLSRDEELDLALRWKNEQNQAALHRMVCAHMRLVVALAARYRHYGLQMADLIQEGHIGLMEAAARFEPERDVRFSTYATWWIRAAIQDHILRNWSIVRGGTSSAQKSLFFNLRRLRAKLAQEGIERVDQNVYQEIAQALGLSAREVEAMDARLSGHDISLNAPISHDDGEGSSERGDFLVDEAPLPDESIGEQMDTERRSTWLRTALNVLNERELKIIRERRLKDDAETLEDIGGKLGISKERVRQIEGRALEKLKKALLSRQPLGFAAFA